MKRNIIKAIGLSSLFALLIVTACNKGNLSQPSSTVNEQSANLASAKPMHHYGCKLHTEAELNAMPRYVAPSSFTSKVAASIILAHPPIGDQGQQGSCVGWGTATTRAIDTYYAKNSNSWSNSTNIMSAAYIYNQVKVSDCSSGAYVTDALNLLKSQGVCTYSLMTYTDANCSKQPNNTQKQDAGTRKIAKWSSIRKSDVASIKSVLNQNKPLVIAVQVDDLFENGGDANHIWKKNNGRTLGGHCITIVGYDDAKNAFYVQNQWGANWGASGMIWIDYGMFKTSKVNEVYSIN